MSCPDCADPAGCGRPGCGPQFVRKAPGTPPLTVTRGFRCDKCGGMHVLGANCSTPADPINPSHYKANGLEVIDVIEAFGLNFAIGNAIKYLLRAGKKGDRLEDLKKARWYIDREIEKGGGK